KLHVDLIDVNFVDGIGRAETMLEHGAGAQVAQFGLDKSAQIARGAVFDAEHGMQVIVVLDDHAGTELGRWNRHRWFTSPYTLLGILGSGAGPGGPSGPVFCLLGWRSPGHPPHFESTSHFTQAESVVETGPWFGPKHVLAGRSAPAVRV